MQTNLKAFLATTGYPVAEEVFMKPPALPYIVFSESEDTQGSDFKNHIIDRAVTVELYSGKIDRIAEQSVKDLLDISGIHYTKERLWIETEMFFQTIYSFNLIEKIGGN